MTPPTRDDVALQWLARNVAWSRRLRALRAAEPAPRVLTLAAPERADRADAIRRDRVA